MNLTFRTCLFCLTAMWFSSNIVAQPFPAARAVSASEVKGRIVRQEDGQPLAGVIVVARWGLLDPQPICFHCGGPRDNGRVIQISETVTDRLGNYRIPGWGPKVIDSGIVDKGNGPQLLVFKPGYQPLDLRNESVAPQQPQLLLSSQWTNKVLTLKPKSADVNEYVDSLIRLQSSLRWTLQADQWNAMPAMTLALHQERARLGADGERIRGIHHLFGRTGKGELLAATSGAAVYPAVIGIKWTLRRTNGEAVRTAWQLKRAGIEDNPNVFYVSPWRAVPAQFAGWKPVVEKPPIVRVYVAGYQAMREITWPESGKTLRMRELPNKGPALLKELRGWRSDIDAALAASANREESLGILEELLKLLEDQCRLLLPDVRVGICFAPDAEVTRFLGASKKKLDASYSTTVEPNGTTSRQMATMEESHDGTPRTMKHLIKIQSGAQTSAGASSFGRIPIRGIAVQSIEVESPSTPVPKE